MARWRLAGFATMPFRILSASMLRRPPPSQDGRAKVILSSMTVPWPIGTFHLAQEVFEHLNRELLARAPAIAEAKYGCPANFESSSPSKKATTLSRYIGRYRSGVTADM